MTIRKLLLPYKDVENRIPAEILDLNCGDKKYDEKYIIIKNFFKSILKK